MFLTTLAWMITQSAMASVVSDWAVVSYNESVDTDCRIYVGDGYGLLDTICGTNLQDHVDHVILIKLLVVTNFVVSCILFFSMYLVTTKKLRILKIVLSVVIIASSSVNNYLWYTNEFPWGSLTIGDGFYFQMVVTVVTILFLFFSISQYGPS